MTRRIWFNFFYLWSKKNDGSNWSFGSISSSTKFVIFKRNDFSQFFAHKIFLLCRYCTFNWLRPKTNMFKYRSLFWSALINESDHISFDCLLWKGIYSSRSIRSPHTLCFGQYQSIQLMISFNILKCLLSKQPEILSSICSLFQIYFNLNKLIFLIDSFPSE